MRKFFFIGLAFSVFFSSSLSVLADDMSIIRDAEIENTLKSFSTPLFKAANLNPDNIKINLINDSSINAFIAKGNNLFINTGLLMKSENPNQLEGVVAHETGHIVGGHIARLIDQNEKTGQAMLLSALAGGAAMLASGRGDVGSAVALGAMSSSMGAFFSYRRSEENAADETAVRILEKTGKSSLGFLQFLKKINQQEALISERTDPYFQTHPLTPDRISFIENHVNNSKYTNAETNPAAVIKHNRMKAKVLAFFEHPSRTLARYPIDDISPEARYSRAIALYRQVRIDSAIKEIDALIKDYPEDPYFYELKGQILFENSRIAESIPYYEKSVEYLPENALLLIGLATARVETGDVEQIKKAVAECQKALTFEKNNATAWRLLASAYGRNEDIARASAASAEYAVIIGDKDSAMRNAKRALKLLEKTSPSYLRMEDILQEVEDNKNKKG